ncbi:DNA replication/repair protein RecF [Eggerthellaceae bacterium 3-80]
MKLRLNRLEFQNFRNYQHFELSDIGNLTIFVGPNAVGKTNIIEGMQLLTAQSSFRHPKIEHLILQGEEVAHLKAEVADDTRRLDFELQLAYKTKKHLLNGKVRKIIDLKGILPSVVFTPDDLSLMKGSSSVRRRTLDELGVQLTPNYYQILKDYEKVIRHKNTLLKENASDALLDSLDDLIITCGSQLMWYRTTLFQKLALKTRELYQEVSQNKEVVSVQYIPSWDKDSENTVENFEINKSEAREKMSAALSYYRNQERQRGYALVGPHADKIEYYLNGNQVSVFGSQGQQRSLVLAIKLAEVELLTETLGQSPLFLLDDVMSELDEERRKSLLSLVSKDVQTCITTAHMSYFDQATLNAAQIIKLPQCKNVDEIKSNA